jgi:hypothetical protein
MSDSIKTADESINNASAVWEDSKKKGCSVKESSVLKE